MKLPVRSFVATILGAAAVGAWFLLMGPDIAKPSAEPTQAAGSGQGAIVVELFTSQSCSSCPPAEELFRDFAQRKDLVALEWHVDYWDSLNVPGAGRWKDPYSSPEWTTRQRVYNEHINGTSSAYTPQAVIGGRSEATGFDRAVIARKVADARKAQPDISITATRGTDLRFSISGAPSDTEATLVTFRAAETTQVKGGENNGRKLSSAHLVTGVQPLGSGAAVTAPLPALGESCALIVHGKNQGPIFSAAYCPA